MKDMTTMIREFNATDFHPLHRMICETIDAFYPGIYPPRAVMFLKEHHSVKEITKRSSAVKILLLISEQDESILATGSIKGI